MAHRRFTEPVLVLASHNAGKAREIRQLLEGFPVEIKSAADLGLDEPEETGTTFEANSILKALAAVGATGLPAIADDSGFCVDALGGDPGIYSARWAGADRDFAMAMRNVEEKLQQAVATTPDKRGAAFVAVLALAWPDGHVETFEGRVEGTCVWPPKGDKGFGYDPVFLPDGHDRTFGEMTPEEKHGREEGDGLSHRARAFSKLVRRCFGQRRFALHSGSLKFLLERLPAGRLSDAVARAQNRGEILAKAKYPTGKFLLEISDSDAESIREKLADLLVEIGLDANSEPNDVGLFIEKLIDVFGENNNSDG